MSATTEPPPLTVWDTVWRGAAAATFGVVAWMLTVDALAHQSGFVLLDIILGLEAVFLLGWRRRRPVLTATVFAALGAVSSAIAGAAVVALISLATRRRWREVIPVVVPWCAGSYVYGWLFPPRHQDLPWWGTLTFCVLTFGICVAVGFYIGARRELIASLRERAETAEREQALREERAKATERARIAREMHDVLAHRISLVAMHAGALAYRRDLSAAQVAAAATTVQENAHQALSELREVLGVLRAETDPVTERPQPTLSDLAELIDDAQTAGTPVRVETELPDTAPLPVATGRTAYRIIQESLTNARKHAPGATVRLALRGEPGRRLEIELRNGLRAGAGIDTSVPGSGMGLTGLTERAELAGGELTYGADERGVYTVRALLPWAVPP